jgi:serine protease AprX
MRRILTTTTSRRRHACRGGMLTALAGACVLALLGAGAGQAARAPGASSWDGFSWGRGGSARHAARPGLSSVIVRTRQGTRPRVERAVRRLGGSVVLRLPLIGGFAATIPSSRLSAFERMPGVLTASPNRRIQPSAASYSAYNAVVDMGSMYNVTLMTGAQAYWQAGFTGKGVDVAVIDSGVAPVDGLDGKVVDGPDLSFESQASNLVHLDSFGHGTHMAGIIAGRPSGAVSGEYAGDPSHFLGMAPDARLVSVKVADAHGATDVSQVIAAISWVVQHRTDHGLNIRVLNLSYGTDSTQDTSIDPLAFAAEQAWKAGIVVVTAAGNEGYSKSGSLTSPARDPLLLAVGAADSNGTLSLKDDTVATFSSSGSSAGAHATGRFVDLVAPGSHIVSLRVPGSLVDQTYSSTGAVTDSLFRGSGTSQAAAVVSGAAALVIQQRPSITPDQVKCLLMTTTTKLRRTQNSAQGTGEVDLQATLDTATPSWNQRLAAGVGTGSLEEARGSAHLNKDGVVLFGERDIFAAPFDSAATAALEASASSWSGGVWNGNMWSGSSWSGNSWSTSSWSANSWSGSSWSSVLWSADSWSGSSWSASSWSGNNWLAGTWADDLWASAWWG